MGERILVDLSGRWIGFYTQHERRRPIVMDLDQQGDRLTGTMQDGCPSVRTPISELAMEAGLAPGADERIVASIRSACPDAPAGPVEAEVQLAPLSTIEGEISGPAFRLRKTHRGPFFAGYRMGEVRLGVLGADPEMDYIGQIQPGGDALEGRWHFPDAPEPFWLATNEGGFYLWREETPSDN